MHEKTQAIVSRSHGRVRVGVRPSAPAVDDAAAVDLDGERRAELDAVGEPRRERLAHAREPRITLAVDAGRVLDRRGSPHASGTFAVAVRGRK